MPAIHRRSFEIGILRKCLALQTFIFVLGINHVQAVVAAELSPISQPVKKFERKAEVPVELTIFIPFDNLRRPVIGDLFGGDNRSFDKNIECTPPTPGDAVCYRIRQRTTLIPVIDRDLDGEKDNSYFEGTGKTRKYDPASSLDPSLADANHPDGKLRPEAKQDTTPGGQYMIEEAQAGTGTFDRTIPGRPGSRRIRVRFSGEGGNPLAPIVGCDIDWDIEVEIDSTDPDNPKYRVTGEHDLFPAYEVYIFNQLVHSFAPSSPDDADELCALSLTAFTPKSGDIE